MSAMKQNPNLHIEVAKEQVALKSKIKTSPIKYIVINKISIIVTFIVSFKLNYPNKLNLSGLKLADLCR